MFSWGVFICLTYCFPGDSIYERSVGFLVKDQLAKAKIAKLKTEKAKKEQEVQGQSKAKIKARCAMPMHSTKSANQCFTFEVISKDPNKLFKLWAGFWNSEKSCFGWIWQHMLKDINDQMKVIGPEYPEGTATKMGEENAISERGVKGAVCSLLSIHQD